MLVEKSVDGLSHRSVSRVTFGGHVRAGGDAAEQPREVQVLLVVEFAEVTDLRREEFSERQIADILVIDFTVIECILAQQRFVIAKEGSRIDATIVPDQYDPSVWSENTSKFGAGF